jgi:hypothetical protein
MRGRAAAGGVAAGDAATGGAADGGDVGVGVTEAAAAKEPLAASVKANPSFTVNIPMMGR